MNPELAGTEWLWFAPSRIHGLGAFSRKVIPAGTKVIQYVGERIGKAESLRRCQSDNSYIFGLNQEEDLDGNVSWNPARFINHSCEPNCDAELQGGEIWLVANRDIRAGEEVTFNYGYDLVDYREHPCNCGAPGCVGYMVAPEFFGHVRQMKMTNDE
jgi:uncharacterized protein